MRNYIGAKIIKAESMDGRTFLEIYKGNEKAKNKTGPPGYHVAEPDGNHIWFSKKTFENAYRLITGAEMCLIIADSKPE